MQDQVSTPIVPHRFFSLNRAEDSGAIVEITQEEAQSISNHIVWEIDPDLFPIKDSAEIKAYFKALAENPSGNVRHLPGFDLIKTT